MADRYWVGGSGTWDAFDPTHWSTSSGGSGGASVPTSSDNVFFDANSGTGTVNATGIFVACNNLSFTSGSGDYAGTFNAASMELFGSLTLVSGMTYTSSVAVYFSAPSGSVSITSAGKTLAPYIYIGHFAVSPSTATFTLQDDVRSSHRFVVESGTFTSNNYSIYCAKFISAYTNTRTINLGSSTVYLDGIAVIANIDFSTSTNLTFNAGTSTFINQSSFTIYSGGKSFYNLEAQATITLADSLTANQLTLSGSSQTISLDYNNSINTLNSSGSNQTIFFNGNNSINTLNASGSGSITLTGSNTINTFNASGIYTLSLSASNTFTDFTFAGRAASTISGITLGADQAINGSFTISAGADATGRATVYSNPIGTQRTISGVTSASLTDVDFRDIVITGAATPVSGTRLGDCKNNSGITFPAPKTVYWVNSAGGNWGSAAWLNSSSGTGSADYFPLAQDAAIIPSTTPSSGSTITVNAAYNLGSIDMSARTSNTLTYSTGTNVFIYGDFTNGTGTTLSGTAIYTFAGRNTQNITTAGKVFTGILTVNSVGGSVVLQDAFTTNRSFATAINLTNGTFNANNYNVTFSGANGAFASSNSNTRTLALGSGTWTMPGQNWNTSLATGLTVTGSGIISMTRATAKTFAGGGIQTYPTLNQGGAGALTVSGSNKFANITNTYSATGATSVLFTAGTTNEFTAFNLTGASGKVCTLRSTTTSQATLNKPSTWYMGANSTDGGNNTGLTFTAGGGIDYLSVSYINGQVVTSNYGNFFTLF